MSHIQDLLSSPPAQVETKKKGEGGGRSGVCVCFYQNILIHEERLSCHLLKLLVREVGLAVWDEIARVVLPTHTHTHTQ